MTQHRISLVVLALVAILLAGPVVSPIQPPVQLAYVYSGSMEPAIGADDGYVLLPPGNVQVGDVITFESQTRDRYVTHRVVEISDQGYITKGDANELTDQSADHGPVRESDIVGKALTVGGRLVTIPHLGSVAAVFEDSLDFVTLVAVAVVGLIVVTLAAGRSVRDRAAPTREVLREGDILTPLVVAVAVFTFAAILVATSTQPIAHVAVSHQTDAANLLTVGEPATRTILLEGTGPMFTHRFVAADGMQISEVAANRSAVMLTVDIPPPERIGPQPATVRVYHYPAVLPRPIVRRLHAVHPLLAAGGTVGTAVTAIYGLSRLIIDRQRPIRKPRSRLLRGLL